MNRIGRIFPLLLCGMAAGCAHQTAPVNLPMSMKSVAIVTAIPPEIKVTTTGLTIFENAFDTTDGSGWQLNEVVAKTATDALKGRFETIRATVSYDEEMGQLASSSETLPVAVKRATTIDRPVDAYLVVWWQGGSIYTGRRVEPERLGFFKERHMLSTVPPAAYADLSVSLIDARTSQTIATEKLASPGGRPPCFSEVPGVEWKDHWMDMSEGDRANLRDALTKLLASCTKATLDAMHLSS